ncbi:AMP-binding protein [Rhizobium leguminosarum bv. viciae]|nr:AMP-binding protein [Rhizobium leguminosarum bv. viciae]
MKTTDGFIGRFIERAEAEPARLFCRFSGQAITFGDLERASACFAFRLAQAGLKSGDRVAVMRRNGPATLALIYALWRSGCVWVPVNTGLQGASLSHIFSDSAPKILVADAEFQTLVSTCKPHLPGLIWIEHETGLPVEDDRPDVDSALPSHVDLAALMYTSGTTGPAKGVPVTHQMMRFAAEAVAFSSSPLPGDNYFMWEPFFHIGGAQVLILPAIRDVTLTIVDRFSASRFWQDVREAGCSHIHYLGGVIQILLKQPPSEFDRDHTVRIAWGGGCPVEACSVFQERFGISLRECYGMTESSSITTSNMIGTAGSVGLPMPWLSVRLADDDGNEISEGIGEIVVSATVDGPLFTGYSNNTVATAAALRGDGFHTGDLGSWNSDGSLRFHGRKTDSVRCRGENVSAHEVEEAASGHPLVSACAMIGVKAEIGEQEIKLFVQLKAGAILDAPTLAEWLSHRLASYQQPRYIAFVHGFERTASQRIIKHNLPDGLDDVWDRTKHLPSAQRL